MIKYEMWSGQDQDIQQCVVSVFFLKSISTYYHYAVVLIFLLIVLISKPAT